MNNIVVGVSTGFEKRMEMVGTGYRASVAGKELTLNVGYSKPRVLTIPEGLKVTVSAWLSPLRSRGAMTPGQNCSVINPISRWLGAGHRWLGTGFRPRLVRVCSRILHPHPPPCDHRWRRTPPW